MQKILVTGAAGFIGFHLSHMLLESGYMVCGIDNLNDYYSPELKKNRLEILMQFENFNFIQCDLADSASLKGVFNSISFDYVIHLAAQAGVRYSIENPGVYVQSNLVGFFNVLEMIKEAPELKHFIYASTSSVYGANNIYPFSESDNTDSPISFYASTKKANEAMAYSYSSLYKIPMTGLRFFTVYGPWGRPDMALFKFTHKILKGEPIEIFNRGELYRDFTYISDIVEGIAKVMVEPSNDQVPHDVYNIGFGNPIKLSDFVDELEEQLGKKAKRVDVEMQQGDMFKTYANLEKIGKKFNYRPKVHIQEGITQFINWYKNYYKA